jgi:hypothetical protein
VERKISPAVHGPLCVSLEHVRVVQSPCFWWSGLSLDSFLRGCVRAWVGGGGGSGLKSELSFLFLFSFWEKRRSESIPLVADFF